MLQALFKIQKLEPPTASFIFRLVRRVAGAPRAKYGFGDSLNIGPPFILILRYKPLVLVFYLITQQRKYKNTFQ